MYNPLHSALKYLAYYCTASHSRGHGIHSPFVFRFITGVLNDKRHYDAYGKAEKLRSKMLQDNRVVDVEDFGAGSVLSKANRRSVASIAKNTAKPKKFGQLLFRMVHYYRPHTIVELGTSLGITTAYLASAGTKTRVITMEGATALAEIAKENFKTVGLENIETVIGNFDETLNAVVCSLSSVDFAFIDGNHRYEPTVRYFSQLLPKIHNDSVFVFDDIHWSREMEQAWLTIQSHELVTCSIDLFFTGIIFFRKEIMEKQRFTIRF